MEHHAAHAPRRDSPGARQALNSELSDPARPADATCSWELSPYCYSARQREEMGLQVIARISLQCSSFRLLNPPLCCSRYLFLAAQIETDTAVTVRTEGRSGVGTSLLHGRSTASRRSGSRAAAAGLEEVSASLLPLHSALSSREGGFGFWGAHRGHRLPSRAGPPQSSAPEPEALPSAGDEGNRVGPLGSQASAVTLGWLVTSGEPKAERCPRTADPRCGRREGAAPGTLRYWLSPW